MIWDFNNVLTSTAYREELMVEKCNNKNASMFLEWAFKASYRILLNLILMDSPTLIISFYSLVKTC